MKIEPKRIKVREIFESYADNGDDGVFAYGGRLAILPPIQPGICLCQPSRRKL